MCGAFGDIAAMSFYPTKNLGGIGEGGMVLSKRKDLGERLETRFTEWLIPPITREMIGINSRLDEIKACALVMKIFTSSELNMRSVEECKNYYNKMLRICPLSFQKLKMIRRTSSINM